jgi:hypothetical protein
MPPEKTIMYVCLLTKWAEALRMTAPSAGQDSSTIREGPRTKIIRSHLPTQASLQQVLHPRRSIQSECIQTTRRILEEDPSA